MKRKNIGSFQNTEISFHNNTIIASVNELIEVVGDADIRSKNNGHDEINFKWNCDFEDYHVFTIYDWKEYRIISRDEQIEWRIGGHSRSHTSLMSDLVEVLLDNFRSYQL